MSEINYQASTVAGNTWVRAYRIEFFNNLGNNLTKLGVNFSEETAYELSNGLTITQPKGVLSEIFTDANANTTFTVYDSVTGNTVQTMTYTEVFNVIASLYVSCAEQRDANALAAVAAAQLAANSTIVTSNTVPVFNFVTSNNASFTANTSSNTSSNTANT